MKARLINILLVLASVLITILLAEFLVRVFYSQDKMITWIEMHPRGFMMNQSGGESFQEFGDRRTEYRFTDTRLRGGEIDTGSGGILALGDSFTFGLHITEQDTYTELLNDKISAQGNFQILNGGVGGAGLADWPAWLKEFGEQISPDIVLLFLNYADLERALSKNLFVIDDETDELIESIRWEPRSFLFSLGRMGWYRWLQRHSELMNGLVTFLWQNFYFKDITNNFDPGTSPVPVPDYEHFDLDSDYSLRLAEKLVSKITDWCAEQGCRFMIATTGFFERSDENLHTYRFYRALKEGAIQGSSQFHDNTPCVMNASNYDLDSIRIPGDSHPDETGVRIIAECTYDWLRNVPELKADN